MADKLKSIRDRKKYQVTRSQFHQRFTHAFFVQNFGAKISNPKASFVIFGAKILYKKCARNLLMKSTPALYVACLSLSPFHICI